MKKVNMTVLAKQPQDKRWKLFSPQSMQYDLFSMLSETLKIVTASNMKTCSAALNAVRCNTNVVMYSSFYHTATELNLAKFLIESAFC